MSKAGCYSKQEPPPEAEDALEQIRERLHDPKRPPREAQQLDPITQQRVADHKTDRKLKRRYARWFIWILVIQLLIMNGVIIATGLKYLVFPEWTLNLYMGGTLAEVFGIVAIITRYLFRPKGD